MKKRTDKWVILIWLTALAWLLASCTGPGESAAVSGTGEPAGEAGEVTEEEPEKEADQKTPSALPDSGKSTAEEVEEAKTEFESTLDFIEKTGGEPGKIEFDIVHHSAGKRSVSAAKAEKPDVLRPYLSPLDYAVRRVRLTRRENGAFMDFDIYEDRESGKPVLIESTEYGTVREVSRYYFDEKQKLLYAYTYRDTPLGTANRLGEEAPGKKCLFSGDAMVSCEISDGDKKYNGTYTAADYSGYDSFVKKQYDELEKNVVNRAYTILDAVKEVPAFARVYGYAADEFGGTLKNTEVVISSVKNDYRETMETDGDGFFAFFVPVNELDWYNLEFHYGDCLPVQIDDLYIRPLTVDYCAGVAYMAPSGQGKHEQNRYLLNVNDRPGEALSEDELEVRLTYDGTKAGLSLSALELGEKVKEIRSKKKSDGEKTVLSMVIPADSTDDMKIVVQDEKSIAEGNLLSYNMSLSDALVQIYNRDGLIAAFPVPAGSAGVTWECAELLAGRVVPWNNYYQEALTW